MSQHTTCKTCGDWVSKYDDEHRCAADAAGTGQESVEGDVLPPVGADVLIHLARQDEWVPHKVTGYYVWPDLKGNPFLQRVFVRVRDSEGYINARMLRDVRRLDGTPFVTDKQAATGAQGLAGSGEDIIDRLRNPMPPLGMLVRALRIVAGTTLMDMARDLQTTPAELSAYECGRKPIPPELPRYAAIFFARNGVADTEPAMRAAMAASRKGEA